MAEPILKLDKYLLVEELGSGGMATVYKAKNIGPMGFEKLAAVKLLHTDFGPGSDVVRMFIDEARVGAKLAHPNVIGVTDFGQIESRYFMAMEYVDGCNLATLMKPGSGKVSRPIPVEAAVCAVEDVLDGLDYVHNAKDERSRPLGIVHRDISPQNVMIDRTGRAKIGDFGIATGKFRESYTNAGIVKGKVGYMSPEQAAGKPLDGRSDIAAAGLTLFAAVSGQSAFAGGDTITVLAQAEAGLKPEAVESLNCPDALKKVILKATCPRLQERYQTAAEFREELAAAVPDPDGAGRVILAGMVARATKPASKASKKTAASRVGTGNSGTLAKSVAAFSKSMPATPLSKFTVAGYRVMTIVAVSACLGALIMALARAG